jgi:hypothetical protein
MNENETTQTTTEPITGIPAEIFESGEEGQETEGQETEGGQPSAAPQQPQQLTDDQIRASVREGLREGLQQPQQPKQYSQDELDQIFKTWKPTPELVAQLQEGGDKALHALIAMREGMATQFGTLLQYSIEVAKRELQEQMNPALTFVNDASAKADREDFFSQHEDLRDHEQLTQTVFNALKAEGYRAPDKAAAFKTLADRTRALIPTSANGAGTGQSSGVRTTTQTTKRPASLSSGSQAGGGGPSAPAAPFPGAEIWQ